MRALFVILLMAAGCSHCTPAAQPTYACADGGKVREYTCPVGDSGERWNCEDGCESPVGTCESKGCVPVQWGVQ